MYIYIGGDTFEWEIVRWGGGGGEKCRFAGLRIKEEEMRREPGGD